MKFGHSLILFAAAIFCSCAAPTVFCQTEKLGIVKYTPPKSWAKTPKENVVAFNEYNQKTGGFCIITLYGATNGTGNPARDFAREWKRLVMSNLKVEADPTTETQVDGEWTMTAGASAAEMDGGGKALAFLSVFSGGGKTVSVLGIFNEQSYLPKLEAFVGSVEMDKTITTANNTTPSNTTSNNQATFDSDGNLVIPQPTRQLTTADFAGVWIDGPNRMTTEYVHSGSGKSAGRDTTAFEVKNTFKSDGTYSSFFHSVRKKYETESDTEIGPYSINGLLLSMQRNDYSGKSISTKKWVIRGWLELPSMTVLELAGPWYNNAEIPEVNFTDFGPNSKYRGVTKWIRLK